MSSRGLKRVNDARGSIYSRLEIQVGREVCFTVGRFRECLEVRHLFKIKFYSTNESVTNSRDRIHKTPLRSFYSKRYGSKIDQAIV